MKSSANDFEFGVYWVFIISNTCALHVFPASCLLQEISYI